LGLFCHLLAGRPSAPPTAPNNGIHRTARASLSHTHLVTNAAEESTISHTAPNTDTHTTGRASISNTDNITRAAGNRAISLRTTVAAAAAKQQRSSRRRVEGGAATNSISHTRRAETYAAVAATAVALAAGVCLVMEKE